MPSVLITGSNRGLGLEWVRQYTGAGWRVYATCRHPAEATELLQLAAQQPTLSVHRLDITASIDVRALRWEIGQQPIDVLLNNAALYLDKDAPMLGSLRYDDWMASFAANTLSAVRVSEALLANVAAGQRRLIVALTSHMGSIAEIESSDSLYYRSSKAALNAAMKGLSVALRGRGIGVLLLHPGWVRTRMGGPEGRLDAAESVAAMRRLIDDFRPADSGRFLRYDGSEIPW